MDWLTAAPPVLAIIVAIVSRNVYWALGLSIWFSETLISGGNPVLGAFSGIDRAIAVFESAGNVRVLLFCLLIGALIAFMRDSGGVQAVVRALMNSGLAGSRRRAALAPALTGTAIFVETNASIFSAGILGRPLFDAHGLSRERLAYIIDSTSAPVSVLILLNGWGAFALGLVEPFGFESAFSVVTGSIPWNLYALLTLAGVYITVFFDRVVGPMKTTDRKVVVNTMDQPEATRPIFMWLPLLVMVGSAIGFMFWTGEGDISKGSGSQSILWAICLALAIVYATLLVFKRYTPRELQDRGFAGIGEMLPVVAILFMSMALGDSLDALGTGDYITGLAASFLSPAILPALIFVIAGVTAFMTGTSWGTYGIVIPIAMPLAITLGLLCCIAITSLAERERPCSQGLESSGAVQ